MFYKPKSAGLCNNDYTGLHCAVKNGEQRVGPRHLKEDGYSPSTNTAFKVYGCYYHGCTCVKPAHSKNAKEK